MVIVAPVELDVAEQLPKDLLVILKTSERPLVSLLSP